MKTKLAYLEGIVSIFINLILFALKLWIGIVTNSIAIIAEGWHSLSDSLTSFIVIIGAKFSSIPMDDEHPYGHGRAELIVALIIGIMLGITGFNFLIESFKKLMTEQSFTYNQLSIWIFVLSIILNEFLAQFSFWTAKKTNMSSLKADGWHHRSDAIASLVIIIGIYLGKYFWWIDGVLGIVVSLLIIFTAITLLKDSMSPLLGEKIDFDSEQMILEIISKHITYNSRPHHFHYHRYGDHVELSFHIFLDGELTIKEGHLIVKEIEKEILEKLNIYTTIHTDYYNRVI